MIELFDNPREDKKSDRPAPKSLVKFRQIYQDAMAGAGEEKNKAQKAKGKFTARERLSYLLDRDSFFEIKSLVESNCHDFGVSDKHIKGDGVITGFGRINGRPVAIFAQDFTQLGGSLGLAHAKKIADIMDKALEAKIPVIGLLDNRAFGQRRRAHSGRGGQFGRLRGNFLPQRQSLRRDSADFRHFGPLRRRGGVFARADGFYFYGGRHQPYVCHGPQRG